MFFAPILMSVALSPEARPDATGRDGDFVMDARVRDLLADGPTVVDVTLTYRGKEPIYTYMRNGGNVHCQAPRNWTSRSHPAVAPREPVIQWFSGAKHVETLVLGDEFVKVEGGFIRLLVQWPLTRPQYGGKGLTIVEVAQPAANLVFFLSPTAAAGLERMQSAPNATSWITLSGKVRGWFEDTDRPSELRERQVKADLWKRTFTYIAAGRRRDPAWREKLLRDLEKYAQPPDEKEFESLLRQLDSPQYAERSPARRRLEAMGPAIDRALQHARSRPLSNEADHQIELLLNRLALTGASRQDAEALRDLRALYDALNPDTDVPVVQVLKALARPASGTAVAAQAQQILSRRPDTGDR